MRNRVLLVDDDALVLRSFQRSMNDIFDTDTALNPYDAIAKLSQDPLVKVVVTDIDMPGMNGLNFLRRIHVQWPHLYCVVLTGNMDPELDRQLNLIPNVVKVFHKPTSNKVIWQVIRHYLDLTEGNVQAEPSEATAN